MARADEFDVIELIDADDSAFAPAGGRERPEKDRQAGAGDQWLLLPTAWVVIGILLMGALAWVWQPWRERPEFTVGPVASVETTLTERLVLDRPIFEGRMADVRVTLDVPTDGYVLADPTAAPWTTGGWADARAAIVAVAAEDPRYVNDSVSTDWSPIAAIQGAPAEYRDGGQSGIQVVFGPVGEQWYEVQSIGLGLDATVALAAVIRWTPHGLIVMDRARLLGLEPLYPFSSFWTAIGLVEAVDPGAAARPATTPTWARTAADSTVSSRTVRTSRATTASRCAPPGDPDRDMREMVARPAGNGRATCVRRRSVA